MPRNSKDIIRIDEIADVFSDAAIARVARRARLPGDPDLKRLGAGIRASVGEYAKQSRQASRNTVHREIDALARAAARPDYEALAQAYDGMSDAARGLLEERSQRIQQRAATDDERHSWKLPEAPALRDPRRRQAASEAIYCLAVTGGRLAKGRKRPGGKQSLEWLRRLHAPEKSRSEPRRQAERTFLMWLRVNYAIATGRMPPNSARRDMGGPFARLFAECLRMVRAPATSEDPDRTGLAVQLINDFGQACRIAKLEADLRQILNPLRRIHPAASELCRLIENGRAVIRRIPLGADENPVPDVPALIEFEETGNLCFYVSQSQWRTIRVKPAPRARIMRLAEGLSAAAAPERRARQRRAATDGS
jgi:hypothetical protein